MNLLILGGCRCCIRDMDEDGGGGGGGDGGGGGGGGGGVMEDDALRVLPVRPPRWILLFDEDGDEGNDRNIIYTNSRSTG